MIRRKQIRYTVSLVGLAVAFSGIGHSAYAEDEDTIRLGEIIVRGENVERTLQQTASSVVVLREADAGESSVVETLNGIGNVVYTSTVGAPIIRGQDAQGANGGAAIYGGTVARATINLDGHYQNFYELALGGTSVWDVDSIEVYRGPQNTSQGANSIAGAIVVSTKDPTFEPEGSFLLEAGSFDKRRGSVAASGPLIEDELAARVSLDYWERDSYIDYNGASYVPGDTDLGFESLSARGKLLWTPKSVPDLDMLLTYSHTEGNRPQFESASAPYDQLENPTASVPSWEQRTDTGLLDIDFEFSDSISLSNVVRYSVQDIERSVSVVGAGNGTVDQKSLSNESLLHFGGEGAITGFVGFFAEKVNSDDVLYFRGISDFDDEKIHLGLFGEATFKFAERWSLIAGVRGQQDELKREGSSSFANGTLDYDKTYSAILPKVSLAFDVTPDATVGVLVNKGYNHGGINLSFANRAYIPFEDETVWNYELFVRAGLFDQRVMVNGNVFFADYTDSQRLVPDYIGDLPYGQTVVNADEAEAIGLEVDVTWNVSDSLRFTANAALLETEVGKFTVPAGTAYVGNEFKNSPGQMFGASVDWDVLPRLKVKANVRYTDGYHSDDENLPAFEVEDYTIANLSVVFEATDAIEIYAYANNVTDEYSPTSLYTDRSVGGIVANLADPRAFGVGVRGTF